MQPRLSCIVSTFHRPTELQLMLLSLMLQTEQNIEIIIADNSDDPETIRRNCHLAEMDERIQYLHCGDATCYQSSTRAAATATGEFVCFPSDDGYYVPGFAAHMLGAAEHNNWDLVYCDIVDDPRQFGRYGVRSVQPALGYIDKTGYIVRRSCFTGFPRGEPNDWAADWWLIEELMKRGVRHGKLDQLLAVHN